MKRWVIAVIIVTLLLVAAGFYLSSQPPPPQPTPQFRAAITSAFGTGATESHVESGGGCPHPGNLVPEHGLEATVVITGDNRC